ncbi:recombinase family protein [Mesorhizobium sp. B1-1-5]|uniref:recombinase family protein n=1 Tax=Mesorhizobium sp. B1-1-5 TaxID=2589979 RepID=UPI0011280F29|nr:recombinase family protein [Mesorhizobium sp. B1-1-5]TPO01481.1 DNA invertase [Mesorhizobium sp. B1-1-5]
MTRYVVYLRLSKARKGEAGLGIEAQQRDVDLFLATYAHNPEVLATFTEVQSGADDDRPELAKALALVRSTPNAELLVAKLDRLSRRVSFIAKLLEDKRVTVRVACMPNADAFQLHIYAALAEQERIFISKRTIAALAVAKSRGKALGGIRPHTERRNEALKAQADARALKCITVIGPMRDSGKTLAEIASALTVMNIPTARGGKWSPTTVADILRRAA